MRLDQAGRNQQVGSMGQLVDRHRDGLHLEQVKITVMRGAAVKIGHEVLQQGFGGPGSAVRARRCPRAGSRHAEVVSASELRRLRPSTARGRIIHSEDRPAS